MNVNTIITKLKRVNSADRRAIVREFLRLNSALVDAEELAKMSREDYLAVRDASMWQHLKTRWIFRKKV